MKKIESFLELIVAITIVLNCNSIWARHIIPRENSTLLYISIFLLTIICFKNVLKSKKVFIRMIITILCINVINIIFITFNKFNSFDYIKKFAFLLSFFIIYLVSKAIEGEINSLLKKISNVMCLLALISLVMYSLGIILNIISPNSQVLISWGDERYVNSYYNLLYETQEFSIFGVNTIRNTGIFTEAPMYAFLLCVALSEKLFLDDSKNRKFYSLILIITVFTTFSTTGIVVTLALVVLYCILNKGMGKYQKIIKFVLVPIVLVIASVISLFFIQHKIEGSRYGNGSYSIRMDDFKVGIQVWSQNKVFGVGYGNYDLVKQYVSTFIRGTDIGGSSGIMHILAQGGLYLLLIHIVPNIMVVLSCINRKNIQYILISTMIIGLLLITAVQYTFIIIYFLAWMISICLVGESIKMNRRNKV